MDLDNLREEMSSLVYHETEEANEAINTLLSTSDFDNFDNAVRNIITQDFNVMNCDELVEMANFVRLQMKATKDAPETAQDVLREHEAEIGR